MKPCVHCGRPLENAVETCPACGRETSRRLGVRLGSEPNAPDAPHDWSAEKRRAWLLGELKAALAVILGNALTGLIFAVVGGLIGYLFGDLTGLVIGAVVAFLLQLVLF